MEFNYKGLTTEEVNTRINSGLVNIDAKVKSKTKLQIFYSNFFTLFNLLNLLIAIAIFTTKEYQNMFFMFVVLLNTTISVVQELTAKKVVDNLNIINKSKVTATRNNKELEIGIEEIVMDDLLILKRGDQVVVDSLVLDGTVEVNESFITGESKVLTKNKEDLLLSGSFVVSGFAVVQVKHIGIENYTYQISKEAKYYKKVESNIINSINKIIKIITFIIIPFSLILFFKQQGITNTNTAIINTAAAIIGMIPEGLVLLTSSVFVIAILRLAKKNVLVKELYVIENLARVDTICFDKTGTITEGKMVVEKVINFKKTNTDEILSNYVYVFKDDSEVQLALQKKYKKLNNFKVISSIPFSSDRKYSKIEFDTGTYILGAPEIILKDIQPLKKYIDDDYRMVLLAQVENGKAVPLSLIFLQDKIRKDTNRIIEFFNNNNVDVKLISGDNPIIVSRIAKISGVKNYDKYVDLSTIKVKNYNELVKKYTIFGRVRPDEKKELVLALQRNKKTVAYVGDGVNDCLALKEAEVGISFKNAREAARNVSGIILLNNDFSSVLDIVKEGRRSINNLERSAALFLVKTTYATLLSVLFLFLNVKYPLSPIQLTLTGIATIGIPSFILALEENNSIIRGNFLANVTKKAIPFGLTMAINILLIIIVSQVFNISMEQTSTMAVLSNTVIGFSLLYLISKPFNKLRKILFVSLATLFILLALILKDIFYLVILEGKSIIILVTILCISFIYYRFIRKGYLWLITKYPKIFNA